LDTDASADSISGIISKFRNGQEKVFAYGSKILNPAQRIYCTTQREFVSIVHFIQHYKHFLLGKIFLVRSDHKGLTYLQNFKESEGILTRWINILRAYEFDIEYRQGTKHFHADSHSRKIKRPCKKAICQECVSSFQKSNITENNKYVSINPLGQGNLQL
jgi:hypothetical protein